AGAFFAAAATEDEIIPRLGELAADISEKIFGVQPAVARAQPPPAPSLPAPAAVPSPAAPTAPAPPAVPGAASAAAPAPSPAPAAPAAPAEFRIPSSFRKIAESGRIADELHGVVSGNADSGGSGEIIAYGKKGIYLYRANGTQITSAGTITDGLPGHMLNVEAADLDADGRKEIVVTGIDGDSLRSLVLKKDGDKYQVVADRMPYFLVLLPDWKGKEVLAGQQHGDDVPFHGRFYTMIWDGKTLRMGEALPAETLKAPLSSGILGLSSARFGDGWKWIYTDENDHLRVLDPSGDGGYKTAAEYGWSGDFFEWGLYLPRMGKAKYFVRKAARVAPGGEGKPLLLAPAAEGAFLGLESSSKTARLALLKWDGGELIEAAATPKGDRIYSGADFLSAPGPGGEGRVVASVIEQPDGVLKGGISRIVLFGME
ncbi:MAG TPA: VCBS repeat-containing protein, partial [Candidatus Aquicultoraceae bacterium]|nr:VCBS repeat-containing protein [Candidatus Aquicultoraceae bacterium]